MPKSYDEELIGQLEDFDTPTISNVVATYPNSELCLKLFDPWYGQWYTDTTIRCIFPELGVRVGNVATVVFSEKSDKYAGKDHMALAEHIYSTKKPVVLVAEQRFPPALANRVGLFGGNSTSQYTALGVVAVVTNGPIRDLDEIGELGVQYFAAGVTPAHGEMGVVDVGVPVTVGGMTVAPGDMVHMDKHGVVKFPPNKVQEILKLAGKLSEQEIAGRKIFQDPNFSFTKWKASKRK